MISKQRAYWVDKANKVVKEMEWLNNGILNPEVHYLTEDIMPKKDLRKVIADINAKKAAKNFTLGCNIQSCYDYAVVPLTHFIVNGRILLASLTFPLVPIANPTLPPTPNTASNTALVPVNMKVNVGLDYYVIVPLVIGGILILLLICVCIALCCIIKIQRGEIAAHESRLGELEKKKTR